MSAHESEIDNDLLKTPNSHLLDVLPDENYELEPPTSAYSEMNTTAAPMPDSTSKSRSNSFIPASTPGTYPEISHNQSSITTKSKDSEGSLLTRIPLVNKIASSLNISASSPTLEKGKDLHPLVKVPSKKDDASMNLPPPSTDEAFKETNNYQQTPSRLFNTSIPHDSKDIVNLYPTEEKTSLTELEKSKKPSATNVTSTIADKTDSNKKIDIMAIPENQNTHHPHQQLTEKVTSSANLDLKLDENTNTGIRQLKENGKSSSNIPPPICIPPISNDSLNVDWRQNRKPSGETSGQSPDLEPSQLHTALSSPPPIPYINSHSITIHDSKTNKGDDSNNFKTSSHTVSDNHSSTLYRNDHYSLESTRYPTGNSF